MLKYLVLVCLLLSACSTLDKTNILPGQQIPALGFSFSTPTTHSWFAVQYGNSSTIHLSQLNESDSYSIHVTFSKGPPQGMFETGIQHLQAYKRHVGFTLYRSPLSKLKHEEILAPEYGDTCIKYFRSGENWIGRNNRGPAIEEHIGLICAHKTLPNVLIEMELSRRYETHAESIDLNQYATELFNSVEYDEQ